MKLFLIVLLVRVYDAYGAEDLFCKDPDTNEYHAVNSTWKSKTFCGNYTCKIRPKNITATEYIPLENDAIEILATKTRQTMADLKRDFHKLEVSGKSENRESEAKSRKLIADIKDAIRNSKLDDSKKLQNDEFNTMARAKKLASNLEEVFKKSDLNPKISESQKLTREAKARKIIADLKDAIEIPGANMGNAEICTNCNSIIEDRYLNVEEVNALAKFLYSVKKSDLDTLIEMYNIASEMYGDIDMSATEETPPVIVQAPFQISQQYLQAMSRQLPYWYPSYMQNYNQYPKMEYSYPYVYTSGYPQNYVPSQAQSNTQVSSTPQGTRQPLNVISQKETLEKDEMKADGSVIHPSHHLAAPIQTSNPIYSQNIQPQISPSSNQAILHTDPTKTMSAPTQINSLQGSTNAGVTYPNLMYAVQPSYPQNYYNYSYPYGQFSTIQYPYINYNPYQASVPTTSHVSSTQILPNSAPIFNTPCKIHNHIGQATYPWKTPSLTQNTLQTIRAHITPRTPAILKPKIPQYGLLNPIERLRLKKIGKVLRLGDLNTRRPKRDANTSDDVTEAKKHFVEEIERIEKDIEDMIEEMKEKTSKKEVMETYITTEICEFETEPGYFKTGNDSLPYPLCCPERLQETEEE